MDLRLDGKYVLLSDLVYGTIKDGIINGSIPAGEKVSETQLARQLNVSRTPVREALRKLSVEGFVKLESNTSFIVCKFEKKDAMEVLAIRRLLEGEAARLAALTLDDHGRAVMEREISIIDNDGVLITEDGASQDVMSESFTSYDIKFHDSVYELAGNEKLYDLSKLIRDKQVRLYLAKAWLGSNHNKVFMQQHREIAEAILEGDADKAQNRAWQHVDYITGLANMV